MLRDELRIKGLSPREIDVAELVAKGMSNKEVATILFVAEKTVKFHMTNIHRRMGFKSRAQLIAWCGQFGETGMPARASQDTEVAIVPQHNSGSILSPGKIWNA